MSRCERDYHRRLTSRALDKSLISVYPMTFMVARTVSVRRRLRVLVVGRGTASAVVHVRNRVGQRLGVLNVKVRLDYASLLSQKRSRDGHANLTSGIVLVIATVIDLDGFEGRICGVREILLQEGREVLLVRELVEILCPCQ